MIRIIITAILIVLLAVLVSFNLRFTTSISIYGAQFEGVPVMVIALLSFAAGVLYSLFLYTGRYLSRRRKQNLEERHRDVARREQELSARESAAAPSAPAASEKGPSTGEPPASQAARGGLRRLFRRGRRAD